MTGLIIAFAIVCLLVAVWIFLIAPASESGKAFPDSLSAPYAHRGLYGGDIPENSMAAFEAARDAGLGIELDIRLTKDGEVVVFHDDTILRMCGMDIPVSDFTYDELILFPLANTEERVPRLVDVLALIDGAVPLLIELKGSNGDMALCEKAATILDGYNGPFCIESFNPLLLSYFKKHRPGIVRGQLVTLLDKNEYNGPAIVRFALSHMLLNIFSRPHFVAYDLHKHPKHAIEIATKTLGATRFAWTIRSPEEFSALRAEGISPIFEHFDPTHVEE